MTKKQTVAGVKLDSAPLLACPFCRCESVQQRVEEYCAGEWYVVCEACRATGPRCDTEERARWYWNQSSARLDRQEEPLLAAYDRFKHLDRVIEMVGDSDGTENTDPFHAAARDLWRAVKASLGIPANARSHFPSGSEVK